MTCTTFVGEHVFDNSNLPKSFLQFKDDAEAILGKRIGFLTQRIITNSWWNFWRRSVSTEYMVLLDLGRGQAQVLNFAPRERSTWSINHWIPEQEVTAWLMGVVQGGESQRREV